MARKLTSFLSTALTLAASLLLSWSPMYAAGPEKITGQVTDASGQPLVGVVVMVSGDKTSGTSTDIDGNYAINVANGSAVLEYSCMGYVTANETINGRNVINVTLTEDNELLDEVVVVGYGVQKKVNLTGSVASIDFAKKS